MSAEVPIQVFLGGERDVGDECRRINDLGNGHRAEVLRLKPRGDGRRVVDCPRLDGQAGGDGKTTYERVVPDGEMCVVVYRR